jgi:repressor LexA
MLSPKQYATYSFIKDFITRNQYAPTMAEIAIGIGIKSRGVVHRYVQALAEAELVRIIPGKRRNIELTDNTQGTELPLMGKIAAGRPIEAIHSNETIDIAYTLLGNDRYALKVQGDSMIEDGIHDGDLIICEYSEIARNGDTVVALVDSETATLKRFYKNNDETITLQPANATLDPMVYASERIKIQGVMIGLLRLSL